MRIWVSVLVVGLLAGSAHAQALKVGSPAPPLAVKEFVKGQPVKAFEKGKVYVVEFWATWCGPCKMTAPHLSQLQRQYPAVTFIGVSVWEHDGQQFVKPYVAQMGPNMDYRVAIDLLPRDGNADEGRMAKGWMAAADQRAIPFAFVVGKDGKIVWMGSPQKLGHPLRLILDGKWNEKVAAAEEKRDQAMRAKVQALSEKLEKAQKSGNDKQALALVDQAVAKDPELEVRLGALKFMLMKKAGATGLAAEYGRRLIKGALKDEPQILMQMAWGIVDPQVKPSSQQLRAVALEAAQRADQLAAGRDPVIADTLARSYFVNGQPAKALACQERAIKLTGRSAPEQMAGLNQRLAEYRKAVKK